MTINDTVQLDFFLSPIETRNDISLYKMDLLSIIIGRWIMDHRFYIELKLK